MAWTDEVIQQVWEKGVEVLLFDRDDVRKDACGAWIVKEMYGNRNSAYGWEIDHINPNGDDELPNLRPLQWENSVDRSGGKLKCKVVAMGTKNMKVRQLDSLVEGNDVVLISVNTCF